MSMGQKIQYSYADHFRHIGKNTERNPGKIWLALIPYKMTPMLNSLGINTITQLLYWTSMLSISLQCVDNVALVNINK